MVIDVAVRQVIVVWTQNNLFLLKMVSIRFIITIIIIINLILIIALLDTLVQSNNNLL